MDFSDKTQLEIMEIIRTANEALKDYSNRSKTKVYSIFIPFDGWKHYIKKENAECELKDLIAEDEVIFTDNEFKVKCSYLNDAELEYCLDLNNQNQ